MPDEVLGVHALTKRFGGLLALDRVDISVRAGEIFGVIGPNGAGKTTLFSCLVGALAPTSGSVRFKGERIDGRPTHTIVRRGLVRTHQVVRPFRDMTVAENVAVGARFGAGRRRGADAGRRVTEILER
ncbi:MAG TPA: ATP-binding cassette domain-containing protein, partial [Thermoanaerobaculia bacterium]|nr:ATP-binding cassette domain-containing protein [Thermoanaerobaculia bacterium]